LPLIRCRAVAKRLTFGHDLTLPDLILPDRIDLKCLDGELTAVRYRHKSDSRTFRVINDPGTTDE
jgi:hypothetical protein